jgi:hypothetical protein
LSVHSRSGRILIGCAAAVLLALAVVLIVNPGDDGSSGDTEAAKTAQDADAKAGARTAQTALEVYATDMGGSYAGADAGQLQKIESTLPDNLEVLFVSGNSYSLRVVSESGVAYSIVRSPAGAINRQCDPPGEAGCPESGDW